MDLTIRAPDIEDISVTKTRSFTCLVYPESAPSNWISILDNFHIPYLISPLHEGEREDGKPLKPHYHIVLVYAGNHTPTMARQVCKIFGAVPPPDNKDFVVQDLPEMCRYLIHMGYPDKPQYSADQVIVHGGIDYLGLLTTTVDTSRIIMDITYHIFTERVTSFIKFMVYCMQNNPAWFQYISKRGAFYVNSLIKSNISDLKLENNTTT